MPLQLVPQPKELKILHGSFDFRQVDTLFISKRASPSVRRCAEQFCTELKEVCHSNYQVEASSSVRSPYGCLLTAHARRGVFVETQLKRPQGYELVVAGHCLSISAVDDSGFSHATRTIRQMIADGPRVPALKVVDYPTVLTRALHLDLKGLTPNFQTLKDAVDRAALYKFNMLIIEYEDRFAYDCAPELRGPGCLSKEQVRELVDFASSRMIDAVPLVQTLGHNEYLLKHPAYEAYREVKEVPQQICPSNGKAVRLIEQMLQEQMELHPSKFVHIGADEAWQIGRCEKCSKIAKAKGNVGLYLDHVARIARFLHESGRCALLWDDMLREASPDQLKCLPKGVGLVYWMYQGKDGQYRPEHLPAIEKYAKAGLAVYGGACVRGASAPHSNVPDYRERMDNVDFWIDAAENTGALRGIVATGWARFSSLLPICDPFPTMWPSALYAAERCWAGLSTSRESFERRLLTRFYGLRPEAVEVVAAHYQLARGANKASVEALNKAKRSAKRSRDILELLECLGMLEMYRARCGHLIENVSHMLPHLENGRADPHTARTLRSQVQDAREEGENLKRELLRILSRRFYKVEVDELIASRFLFFERLSEAALKLLAKY